MLNMLVSVAAFIVGAAQLLFLFNLIWSRRHGEPAGGNPWGATTLEWQTPETPPGPGNWGSEMPVVHRWAYNSSVPGAAEGFLLPNPPQGGEARAAAAGQASGTTTHDGHASAARRRAGTERANAGKRG